MRSKKKIIIFTGDDMFYAPLLINDLINKRNSDIHHIYISKSFLSFQRLKKKFKFFFKNGYPFCISLKDWLNFFKLHLNHNIKCLLKKQPRNIKEYLKSKGINSSYIKNLNDKEFYKKLREQKPDLFFFACFDKIASEELCEIPKFGTYNNHLGKLPYYKGGLSSFWVLRFNNKFAGSSIHKVTKDIDSGSMIEEIRFKIEDKSMHLLMIKTVINSSAMITKTIDNIFKEKTKEIDISDRKSNYFYYPSKKDFKEFYKKGYKLI